MQDCIEALDSLRAYKRIVVTGPQRSGTTITAQIIQRHLNYHYIDEGDIDIDSLYAFSHYLAPTNVVIHGPGVSHLAHLIDYPECCVVFMIRNIQDIISSQQRVGWDGNVRELRKYFIPFETQNSAEIKYKTWHEIQRQNMKVAFLEFEYESLQSHPLWIEKDRRVDFDKRQWFIP